MPTGSSTPPQQPWSIETLSDSDRPAAAETIADAFQTHPMMPVDSTGRKTLRMASTMLNTFASAPDARLFGARRDGSLAGIAFVYDGAYEPKGFRLVVFLIQMVRLFGLSMSRMFARLMSEKPKLQEQQLELMLLATRTEVQGQGLGRVMLRHVYEYARDRGYESVVLEVAKETPAFDLYIKEGFQVDKEVTLPMCTLCFVRRPV